MVAIPTRPASAVLVGAAPPGAAGEATTGAGAISGEGGAEAATGSRLREQPTSGRRSKTERPRASLTAGGAAYASSPGTNSDVKGVMRP